MKTGEFTQQARNLKICGEYDVIVAGGGMAGVGAAIAASRNGCKTLLIEVTSALGGLATFGLVNIPLGFVCGIGKDMFKILKQENALWHRNTDPEKHKLVLDRMVLSSGCDIMFVSYIVDTIVSGDKVTGVIVENKSGRQAIMAKRFIDCSGDADMAYFAGAETMQGRPGDGMSMACSLEFRLGGVDWDMYNEWKHNDPKWTNLIKQALKDGDLPYEVDNHLNWITHVPGRPEHCGKDEVSICFAHSRNCYPNDAKDLSRMYIEGREQIDFLTKFIRKRVPGFAEAFLVDSGPLLGVRESRRIAGEYILTAKDIASSRKFDDVVTISAHGYDLHGFESAGNIKWAEMEIEDGSSQYVVCNEAGWGSTLMPEAGPEVLVDYQGRKMGEAKFDPTAYNDIPYRSLLPIKLENLLAAGRCLSSDIMAQSANRLVMTCLTMGEVCGEAAAMSLKDNVTPRQLEIKKLQTQLIKRGVNIGQNNRRIEGLENVSKGSKILQTDVWEGLIV